jgi:hypothetical protein
LAIIWNSRAIADTSISGIHGQPAVGGHVLRFSIKFEVSNWDEAGPAARVSVLWARAQLGGTTALALGTAFPETSRPFKLQKFSHTSGALFDLVLTRQAMEALEAARNGQDLEITLNLLTEVHVDDDVHSVQDKIVGKFNVSQWLPVLDQCGYGRSLLFEVPIPPVAAGSSASIAVLEDARNFIHSGHYPEAVARCRMALECLVNDLGLASAMSDAVAAKPAKNRTRLQRELVMLHSAINFAHLAHHPSDEPLSELFDRNAAQMMLATTAALISSSMARARSADLQ